MSAVQAIEAKLKASRPAYAEALEGIRHLNVDRFVKAAVAEVKNNNYLAKCDPNSILKQVYDCAQLGLEPSSVKGTAYLVPYGKNCQLVVGYRGLIELARNSGEISEITMSEVRQNDYFKLRLGTDSKIEHNIDGEDGLPMSPTQRGDVKGFYATAKFKDGSVQSEFMHVEEVEEVRNESQGYKSNPNNSPWGKYFVEMGKKTVLRRLSKKLPASASKLHNAIKYDEAYDSGKKVKIEDDVVIIDNEAGDVLDDKAEKPKPKTNLDDFADKK